MNEPIQTTVIPAAPGWSVCLLIVNDDEADDFDEVPVIAWAVVTHHAGGTVHTHARPVTAEMTLTDDAVLKRPDGRFVFVDDVSFTSRADAIAYALARERAQRGTGGVGRHSHRPGAPQYPAAEAV